MAKILEMEVRGDTEELQKAEPVQMVEEPELESPDYADADDLIDAAVLEGLPDPRTQELTGGEGGEEPLGSRFTEEYREFLVEQYGDGVTEEVPGGAAPEETPEGAADGGVPAEAEGETAAETEELSEAVSAAEEEEAAAEAQEEKPAAEEAPAPENAAETAAEEAPAPETAETAAEEAPEAEKVPMEKPAPEKPAVSAEKPAREEKGIRGFFRKIGRLFRKK